MFSVGDNLGQRSGIVTVVVGGVHLPNVLIDSGATCKELGSGLSRRNPVSDPKGGQSLTSV